MTAKDKCDRIRLISSIHHMIAYIHEDTLNEGHGQNDINLLPL